MGASGSQTTLNSGLAVLAAAEEVAERLRELAAEHLEVAPEDLELREGAVVVRGVPSRRVAIEELTATGVTVIGKGAAEVREPPPCEAEACSGRLGLESFTAPCFFTHAVRIRVDRETGITRVLRVVAAHDSGTIINPIGAEGQVYGGVAMGIGMALTEGTLLDAEGRQRNASLLDYKLATVADMPEIDVIWVETPTENAGPNGGKGVGEPPCIGTPAAIGNAIAKIVGRHVDELPMTAERIWDAARG
jgi:CO/xanthine dehydrogenase Mo-binding subunit